MLKIYGNELCPDCIACKKNFDHYGISYEFIDVMKNLKNLKEFLFYRDTSSVFDHLKAIHDIGLPAIIKEDGEVFTDWQAYLKEKGLTPFINEHKSCSLNGKGC
ncbi:MAG TPA: glutaredoxin [Firmicutes bacterium]|nr:glutaredoxin [Bacillota bacterium]